MNRKVDGPFIMPIVDKYKDMGTVLMGKVESGECRKGQNLVIMPNRVSIFFCIEKKRFKLFYIWLFHLRENMSFVFCIKHFV